MSNILNKFYERKVDEYAEIKDRLGKEKDDLNERIIAVNLRNK
jgi:hypothetical protein